MDPGGVKAITFDCYGTLIDWEAGVLRAIRPMLTVHGVRASDEEIVGHYAEYEAAEEAGEYKPYREVLRNVVDRFADGYGFEAAELERERLPGSIARWEPFADTKAALRALAERYRLVVVSNIDDELFEATAAKLGHTHESPLFEWIVTAEYCRSYKPGERHFRVALALLGLEPGEVLHAAQSRFHDLAPASRLGFRTAWINRRSVLPGRGMTPAGEAGVEPGVTVPDLASLARRLGV
jgi:2-haloacid dehalogenase